MTAIRISLLTLLVAGLFPQTASAQDLSSEVRIGIGKYLTETARKEIAVGKINIDSVAIKGRELTLFANVNCSYIPFREENVASIYSEVRNLLPAELREYKLQIRTDRHTIEELIPLALRSKKDKKAQTFSNTVDKPLITRLSIPYTPNNGLLNRHIALWQSHGWYYEPKLTRWEWQRARIFQTVEDLYTQSYVLQFLSSQYKMEYVVQPLPVSHMSLRFAGENEAEQNWQPVDDPLEPTAKADRYIVYTRIGNGDFDNGVVVNRNSYRTVIPTGVVCSFKVVALNKGGQSFPSEILSIGKAVNEKGIVLVINGFDRISAPADFTADADTLAGFLDELDHGVPYKEDISYIGPMKEFHRQIPWMDDDASGFGDSYGTHETMVIAGNTFDYPAVHGSAILKTGYSFVSCGLSPLTPSPKERRSTNTPEYYNGIEVKRVASPIMSEPWAEAETFTFYSSPNPYCYVVESPDAIEPASEGAYTLFRYSENNLSAGIAYQGAYKTCVLGFPFEAVRTADEREQLMKTVLDFFQQ